MNENTEKTIDEIVNLYNNVNNNIDEEAKNSIDRAYGGVIRSNKGTLVETIADQIILTSWQNIGGNLIRIVINSDKIKIPIKKEYLKKFSEEEIRFLENNNYRLSVDRHVFIDGKFVLGMECKAFTENAMLKRILVDFHLLKTLYPKISCYLLQLESQLGGDYSECKEVTMGSHSTHTILSYFPDVDLNIITLVKGERKVDRPIHKPEYFKPIVRNQINKCIDLISEDLKDYL